MTRLFASPAGTGSVCFYLMCWPLSADVMLLKNGDRLTGTTTKVEGATVWFKSESFGDLSIAGDRVQSLVTDQEMTAYLKDGRTVKGQVIGAEGKFTVGGAPVLSADLVAMRNQVEQTRYERLMAPGWSELWQLAGSFNWAGTRGNADTNTATVSLNAGRTTLKDATGLRVTLVRATARSTGEAASPARAARSGAKYDRKVSPRAFVNSFMDIEHDRAQRLALRTVAGTGLGALIAKGETGRVDLVGGAAFNHETFEPSELPRFSRNTAEAYGGNDMTLRLRSSLNVVQSFRFFTPIASSGAYRVNVDLGLSTKITRWVTWNMNLSDRYLASPLAGKRQNDILYSTGFGFTLQQK